MKFQITITLFNHSKLSTRECSYDIQLSQWDVIVLGRCILYDELDLEPLNFF